MSDMDVMKEKALKADGCPGLAEAVSFVVTEVTIFPASMTIIG